MPQLRPLLLLLCALALTACRDPETEAALLATLDAADDVVDAQIDVPDDAASEVDAQPDLADSLQADTPDGFELPDTFDAEVDAPFDLANGSDAEPDAKYDLQNDADAESDADFELPNGADAEVDADFELPDAPDGGSDAILDVVDAAADGSDAQGDVADVDLCAGVTCTDKLPCQIGSCSASTGTCSYVNAPGAATCSDGNACTIGDACSGGTCLPGSVTTCDDGNSCTSDFCVMATGCTSTTLTDNASCGPSNICLAGVCTFKGCGDGVCEGTETAPNCPKDCLFLVNHYGGPCTTPGSKDSCGKGYFCVARSSAGGGNVCVADFDTWVPIPDSHPASDFVEFTDYLTDVRTGLSWAKESLGPMDWNTALTACSAKSYGGAIDWRLPTRTELLSLADRMASDPAISAPNLSVPSDQLWYWTSIPQKDDASEWAVNSMSSWAEPVGPTGSGRRVRCVRGLAVAQSAGSAARYVALDGGQTVLDRITGLRWQHSASTIANQGDANNACATNAFSLPGVGWRSPTSRELESLVDTDAYGPAADPGFFNGTASARFWSGTISVPTTTPPRAWIVDMLAGASMDDFTYENYRVRCVRDCDGDCSAICGDGVCNGSETVSSCATDCAFLASHYAGTCTVPGSQDICAKGYVCAERGGGSDVCVADFDTWPTLPLAHTASDFTSPSANIVSDTRTGLMWGKVTQASEPWSSAPNACNQLIDGLMDWHLPTAAELASLIDFTTTSPSASAPGMDFTKGLVFWTTTPAGTSGGKWWQVNFQDGELQSANGATPSTVACVRTSAPLNVTGIGTRFASQDGGATVLDRISGLHWQHDVIGTSLNWPGAKAYCATLGTGWRMPTIVELRSILDRSGTSPALDNAFAKPPYGNYWSGTESGGSAWQIDFYSGNSNGQLQNNLFAVRCVR